MTRSRSTEFWVLAALTAVYFAAGKLGLALAFVHASASAVWPPTGIALAACLILGLRAWPAILVGAFAVNVTTEGSLATSLGIALGNTLEGVVGAGLVHRLAGGRTVFDRAPDIVKFALLAGVLATTLSASVGVASLALGGFLDRADAGSVWLTWWLGDLAGALVVTPALVLWTSRGRREWMRRRGLEAGLVLGALVALGAVLFGEASPAATRHYPLAFTALPILLWAAFRLGPRGAAGTLVVLAVIAVRGTLAGRGPFVVGTPNESLLILQAFMAISAVTVLGVAALVAERARSREALETSEAAYRQMFQANPHPMWIIDQQTLRFLAVNDAAVTGYGWSPQGFLGMTVLEIQPPEDASAAGAAWASWREGLSRLGTVRHRRRDGGLLDVEMSIHPVPFGGRRALLALAYDVTERRRTEEERRRLLALAQAARESAEAASLAKDEFLATLSHELRTPLNAILGWVSLLRAGTLDAETGARALEIIERNTRLQSQLVEDLLDVSRIISGKLRLARTPVALPAVLEAALDAVRPAAAAKGVHIETALAPGVGPVMGDAARLQQVVWNLLTNAVKFTGAGGRVTLQLEPAGPRARIQVCDPGQGIRPDFLPYLFDRFRQADSTTTRLHGGLGLGLAIVRSLVELHEGTVRAESPGEGQGATFTVELPVATTESLASAAESVDAGLGVRLDGVRVLVVDDEADAREVVSALLAAHGADVTAVVSVADALDAVDRWKPAVLVADLAMPGADGYALIRTLRGGKGPARRLPALALTAHARAEDRQEALAAGYQMHLAKPVEPTVLARAVARLARLDRAVGRS